MPSDERDLARRVAPLEMEPEEFRAAGRALVDRVADLLGSLRARKVTTGEPAAALREILGDDALPSRGLPAGEIVDDAAGLLFEHSLFNGHPRFFGYITASAAPIGVLADLLAAAVNPNCGAWELSPMANAIEEQTVRWIAELVGFPSDCGGLLVSGGNVANFVCFLAARRARAGVEVRAAGLSSGEGPLTVYASSETHTWIHKAADLFGQGTDAIRWVPADGEQRMDIAALRKMIAADRAAGARPFLIVGTAGSVSTGAIDPLREIAAIAREEGLWFHADGAYGAPAAALPDASEDLRAISLADSLAVDPHKWLYAPLEAGCVLVRDRSALPDAFAYTPTYYAFDQGDENPPPNFYALGFQNSRGFRALKVWMGLKQAGREGYVRMIGDDCRLARALAEAIGGEPDLELLTCSLSIVTFRYAPKPSRTGSPEDEAVLDRWNEALLEKCKKGGELFVSNARVSGRFALRACIVNFRTTLSDVQAIPGIVAGLGRSISNQEALVSPRPSD
ncbi:MAG: aspartate aminotransferase family protein [Acidobacteriota bacterium]